MTKSRSSFRWRRAVVAAALGLAFSMEFLAAPARASDDDDVAPDTQIFRNVLKGLGLRRDEEGIDYRERSPLVLPRSRELPRPERDPIAAKTPAWPVDPDVKRAKEIKAARAKPNLNPEEQSVVKGVDGTVPGSNVPARSRTASAGGSSGSIEEASKPMSPWALGSPQNPFSKMFGTKTEEYKAFTSEPPRARLVEPPPGYRTPSPNQPYGVGKDKWRPGRDDYGAPPR